VPLDRNRDVPAAAPLLLFVLALTATPWLVHPAAATWGCVVTACLFALLRRGRATCCLLLAALAIFVSTKAMGARAAERRAFAGIDAERFVTVEAPLTREWSERNGGYLLIVDSFDVVAPGENHHFAVRLLLHAAFPPPHLGMARSVVASGFLRLSDRGDYVLGVKSSRLLAYRGRLAALSPAGANRAASQRLLALAAQHPRLAIAAGLVEALALGNGEHLSAVTRDSYRRGGTYHLLVFSGLQVAFAAAFIALITRWLHRPRAGDWLLLVFAAITPAFTGATASVTRSCMAVGLYAVSRLLKRPTSATNLLFVSALARLIVAPAELTDVAFQLTYAGAGALLFIGRPLSSGPSDHRPHRLRRLLQQAFAAELAITPLTLLHFHQYAVGGPFLLALLAPLVVAMLALAVGVCITIFVAPPVAVALLLAVDALDRLCVLLNEVSAGWLHLSGFAMAPPVWLLALVYAGVVAAIALATPRIRTGLIVVLLATPLVFLVIRTRQLSETKTPRLEMLDVGQGDSLLLRDGAHAMLVDGGGRNDDERFGETTLLPLLVDRGVRRLDVVALSHAHPDHCGGLPAVIRHLSVGEVWLSPRRFRGPCAVQILEACNAAHVPIRLIRQDATTGVGPLLVSAIAPRLTFKRAPENNSSVVYRVRLGGVWILLTGDIERDAESRLVAERADSLAAGILKVAHHGSRTSSTPAFLDAVHPRLALISCGRHNVFGHPNRGVVEALTGRRVDILRTDLSGTVSIEVFNGQLRVTREIDTFR
jgi:competence protein ComEC